MPPSTARIVLLPRLLFLRHMGGGPRTFPGGLNKWQWKRLHEKKARDKEKLLLNQEKELYQARLRSQIRRENLGDKELKPDVGDYMPMSPEDHVKALADRFVKAGAEDLWNEDDGPISKKGAVRDDSLARAREHEGVGRVVNSGNAMNVYGNWQQKRGYSTSVMKLFGNWKQRREYSMISMNLFGNRERARDYSANLINFYRNSVQQSYSMSGMSLYGSWKQRRGYSMTRRSRVSGQVSYRRNGSSESEDDEGSGDDGGVVVRRTELRWPWFEIGEDDEEEEEGRGKSGRKFGSSDVKVKVKVKEGRGLGRFKENKDDGLSERVERIRQEVNERKMLKDEEEKSTESFLSDKSTVVTTVYLWFEDSDISPLTLKALTSAGYMHMTRVQEATVSLSVTGFICYSFIWSPRVTRNGLFCSYITISGGAHSMRICSWGPFWRRGFTTHPITQSSSFQHWFKNWQDLRKNKLTASTFGGAVGFFHHRRVDLWLEKLGAKEPFAGNFATCWNNIKEEDALERYKLITGNTVTFPSFQVHGRKNTEDDWLAASPDGAVQTLAHELPSRGVLEIKCPFFDGDMRKAFPWKRIPLYYMPQAQGLMEIMDRDWMDFYVWTTKGSSLFRIERDMEYWDTLKVALSDFWWKNVQPAKEMCTRFDIKDPCTELLSLKPEPKHELCSFIVCESKRLVDKSMLLMREINGIPQVFRYGHGISC
ncbi:putative DEAD-box ATP-dependent RNA helicase 33 [Drosera capensis]